jgi:hypothetical protein
MDPRMVLLYRILDQLVDDEEYLEEIYLGVSFSVEDHVLTRYNPTFRMTTILEELNRLEQEGFIVRRKQEGWPESAGIHCVLFSLTEAGRRYWEANVKPHPPEKCYKLAEGVEWNL